MLLSPIQGITPVITQKFGVDFQINGKWAYKSMGLAGHNGIDYRAKVGTPIFAAHDGEVVAAKKDTNGYGWHIKLRSAFYGKETVYGHLSQIDIKVGDTVAIGQQIGLSGNTGFSTAPHLHFGYRRLLNSDKPLAEWPVYEYDNGFFGYRDPIEFVITWEGNLTKAKI